MGTVIRSPRRVRPGSCPGSQRVRTDAADAQSHTASITGNDRVTVASVLYEVVRPPHEHLHPRTGDGAYVSAVIRRVS